MEYASLADYQDPRAVYVTIARRSGKDWFVGSITDEDARELDMPLSFLGSGAYDAEIYSDGSKAATEPKDSVVAKQRVDAKTVLTRNVRIDLSAFIGRGAQPQGGCGAGYHATLLRDTGEPAAVKIEHLTPGASDSLSVDLRSGGGFVAMLK